MGRGSSPDKLSQNYRIVHFTSILFRAGEEATRDLIDDAFGYCFTPFSITGIRADLNPPSNHTLSADPDSGQNSSQKVSVKVCPSTRLAVSHSLCALSLGRERPPCHLVSSAGRSDRQDV